MSGSKLSQGEKSSSADFSSRRSQSIIPDAAVQTHVLTFETRCVFDKPNVCRRCKNAELSFVRHGIDPASDTRSPTYTPPPPRLY